MWSRHVSIHCSTGKHYDFIPIMYWKEISACSGLGSFLHLNRKGTSDELEVMLPRSFPNHLSQQRNIWFIVPLYLFNPSFASAGSIIPINSLWPRVNLDELHESHDLSEAYRL